MIDLATALCAFLLPAAPVATDAAPDAPEVPAEAAAPGIFSAWLDVGIGGPTGYIGGHLDARLLPALGVSVHAGAGASGTQLGLGLRGYLYSETLSSVELGVVLDLAYSAGIKGDGDVHEFAEGVWHWAHLGFGGVFRPASGSGLAIQLLAGASTLMGGPGMERPTWTSPTAPS